MGDVVFWSRVKIAAEEAVMIGIKIVVISAIILAAFSVVVGDYSVVRQRAVNGQQAFEFVQKKIQSGEWKP